MLDIVHELLTWMIEHFVFMTLNESLYCLKAGLNEDESFSSIQLRDAIFQFLKVKKAMHEGKRPEIFTQNYSKYHSASNYL